MLMNRYTLSQVPQLTLDTVAKLSAEELAALCDEAKLAKRRLEKATSWLHAALVRRYGDQAQEQRNGLGKDTGMVRFVDDGFDVSFDLPKRVSWNQKELAGVVRIMREQYDTDPSNYIDQKLSVSEAVYASAPTLLKDLLEPARTVKTGKPVIEVKDPKADDEELD